jgi:hypothetical protein
MPILVINFNHLYGIILSYKMGIKLLTDKLSRELLKNWVANL